MNLPASRGDDTIADVDDEDDEPDQTPLGYVQFDDGTWAAVDRDGWHSEPVALEFGELPTGLMEELRRLPSAFIDIEPAEVIDTEVDR